MTILERYIFKRAAIASLASLAALVSIVWIVQALSRIDIVKTSASAAGNVFWIALMLLPNLAAGVIPFAILLGSVQTLNGLNSDSERAVMSASGASQRVILRPILALGAIGALIMLLIAHLLGPMSASAFQNGIRSINADTITLFLQPGRFEEVQPGLIVSVGDSRGSVLSDLVIADRRDTTNEMTYFASQARIVDDETQSLLILQDGQLHRRNRTDGSTSVINFESYAFDLATLRPSNSGDWIRRSERSTYELLFPDEDDELAEENPNSLIEELTDRSTGWLMAFAFSLWAVVVAGTPSTNRRNSSPAMLFGLAGAVVLKALSFVAVSLVGEDPAFAALAFALPISAIVLNSILITVHFDPTSSRLYEQVSIQFERMQRWFEPKTLEEAEFAGGGPR